MTKADAILKMNSLSYNNKSFVFIINYDITDCNVWETKEIPTDILINFPTFKNTKTFLGDKDFSLQYTPIKRSIYTKGFLKVKEHLQRGDSYLVNYTAESKIESNFSISQIFQKSKAPYKLIYKDKFVVFSPETFITINHNKIQTFPMKGTIDANIYNAENIIYNDSKEKAEHATIVDLLRNDISKVAYKVSVDSYRYIDKIKTNKNEILQVSSKISGILHQTDKIGDIIFPLLPAGSVTGAPKKKTCEIINKTETHNRGFYSGIMGYYDGKGNLDSAVMIRFIEQRNNKLYFKSGGGITTLSDEEKEYNELIQKIYVPIY